MDAIAPAKAILSGEHAVVYGAPALAVAVQRYAHCQLAPSDAFRLRLDDLQIDRSHTLTELNAIHRRCQAQHRAYLKGQIAIDNILAQESDLLLFALVELLAGQNLSRLDSLDIRVDSQIPVGAGMGSSAAIVAALLRAVAAYMNLNLSTEALLKLTHQTEQLQHGRSSGIDPAICCRGGAIRFCRGEITTLPLSLGPHWYLADTGRPTAGTGVCVEQVRRGFADSAIWSEFSDVTEALEQALAQASTEDILVQIQHNHRLLCEIGVVPTAVQEWIKTVEASGGAAKISGAGAVAGDNAGLVLIYHPELPPSLQPQRFNPIPLEVDNDGARVRD